MQTAVAERVFERLLLPDDGRRVDVGHGVVSALLGCLLEIAQVNRRICPRTCSSPPTMHCTFVFQGIFQPDATRWARGCRRTQSRRTDRREARSARGSCAALPGQGRELSCRRDRKDELPHRPSGFWSCSLPSPVHALP